ncbi:MAG: DsbA family protein [Bryobacteraceae bacterium]|nr:DsbA family protein [Bryobacteraceae bacterium]
MNKLPLLLTALLLGSLAYAQTKSGPPKATATQAVPQLDKAELEEYVRHLFVWGPQIQIQVNDPKSSGTLPGFRDVTVVASAGAATQEIVFHVAPDGKHIIQGNIYTLGKSPFESDLNKIRTDLQPSFGTAGAPVVIVIYSDFQCSFCREEAQAIRKEIPAAYKTEVRVYFKDFPLESIHPWAKSAAIAGRCVFRQKPTAFWEYHDWIFENQGTVTPENLNTKVAGFAKDKGLEPVQLNACMENKATESEVDRAIAEARSLGINSTPTMFVNGRRMVGQTPWPQLKQVIDHEIEYAKTHGGGEKCCEVKLPSPLNR